MNKLLGIAAFGALLALPSATFAQSFAYVNNAGDVSMVEADTASQALMTAPNIDEHSGVMLLSSTNDDVLDENVTVR